MKREMYGNPIMLIFEWSMRVTVVTGQESEYSCAGPAKPFPWVTYPLQLRALELEPDGGPVPSLSRPLRGGFHVYTIEPDAWSSSICLPSWT